MTAPDYVVRFVVNKENAEKHCVCGHRVAHQHIVIFEVAYNEMVSIVDEDLMYLEDSAADQAAMMTKMCRKALKLNMKEVRG